MRRITPFLLLFLSACVVGEQRTFVLECVLPEDQTGTFSGRWPIVPIPLSFSTAGQFSELEAAEVLTAADTWNEFYNVSQGFPLFDYGEFTNPNFVSTSSQAPPLTTVPVVGPGGDLQGSVTVYKYFAPGSWSSRISASGGDDSQIIALTSFDLPTGAETLPPFERAFVSAMIELNFEFFFVTDRVPDLRSIMLHELGHLIGLRHSCEQTSGEDGVPACGDPEVSPDYLEAVMHPVFQFFRLPGESQDTGEIRRDLRDNDMGRANCIYEDLSSL